MSYRGYDSISDEIEYQDDDLTEIPPMEQRFQHQHHPMNVDKSSDQNHHTPKMSNRHVTYMPYSAVRTQPRQVQYVRPPLESNNVRMQKPGTSSHVPSFSVNRGILGAPRIARPVASTISNAEKEFLESVDCNKPLLENLNTTVTRNVVDVGKMGIVLLKYSKCSRLDTNTYDMCVRAFTHFDTSLMNDVSSLGAVSLTAFQHGQCFLMNVFSTKMAAITRKNAKLSEYVWKPSFKECDRRFIGNPPFKHSTNVTVLKRCQVPSDLQRAITHIVKEVLSQILENPVAHQKLALRFDDKNAKKDHEDVPKYVVDFIQEFCMSCFGYPVGLLFSSYSLEDLSSENPSLASKIGDTPEDREKNYPLLREDAYKFSNIIIEKIQRTLNDLRKSTLQRDVHEFNGKTFVTAKFVCNSKSQPNCDGNDTTGPPSANRTEFNN